MINGIVTEYKGKIKNEDADNSYFLIKEDLDCIISTLQEDYNIKDGSLQGQIIEVCNERGLKIISRYGTTAIIKHKFKANGENVVAAKVTYAFQDIKTKEIYSNIVLDCSPFKSKEVLYNTITDFNYLKTAKMFCQENFGETLITFKGSSKNGDDEGVVIINSNIVDKKDLSDYSATAFTKAIKKKNIEEVLIPIMFGPNSKMTLEDMYCLISKNSLTQVGPVNNSRTSFDLHHLKVVNGGSEHKSVDENGVKVQPSNLLLEGSLSTNPAGIKDLMGTIIMEQTSHKFRHILWGSEQGIEVYAKKELPYCLQTEKRYNRIIELFNIQNDEGYASFISKQTNSNTPKEYHHKKKIIK